MCQSPPHAPGATGAQDPQLLKNTPPHLSHILFASLNLSVRPHARTPGILPTGPFFFQVRFSMPTVDSFDKFQKGVGPHGLWREQTVRYRSVIKKDKNTRLLNITVNQKMISGKW